MPIKIGNVELNGRLVLAPMAGVTDAAFRAVCCAHGAAMSCSEMISSKALTYGDKRTRDLLDRVHDGTPAAVQIFGHEPDTMARAAEIVQELTDCDIIDINMGCPVGKIAGNGDGSALMKDPGLAEQVIRAVVSASSRPVTVKFRKGWDKGNVNAVEFAQMCESAGASAIAVHGRTRVQMYEGRADWDIIRDVRKAVSIPVIANGDVWNAGEAAHILAYTGCPLAMVGRGSFGNPWIFERGNAEISGLPMPEEPNLAEKMKTAGEHIRLAAERKGERLACLEARRHLCWYLKGVPYAGSYKMEIVRIETLEDVERIIREICRDLGHRL